MINEKKVRLMTRMAIYESNEGKEDLEINTYSKKDYMSYHTITTVILVTIAYIIIVGIGAFTFLDVILSHMSFTFILLFAIFAVAIYLALVISYGVGASKHYEKKYEESRKRIKLFRRDLIRIGRIYDREVE